MSRENDAVHADDVEGSDRPTEEPEGATQHDQYMLLRETDNVWRDMTEEEGIRLLEAEFGRPNEQDVYGAPDEDEEP